MFINLQNFIPIHIPKKKSKQTILIKLQKKHETLMGARSKFQHKNGHFTTDSIMSGEQESSIQHLLIC